VSSKLLEQSTWKQFRFNQSRFIPKPSSVSRKRRPLSNTASENVFDSSGSKYHGRRLYDSGWASGLPELYATHLKVWLYALPAQHYPRVVVLDLDMVVTANIDFLFVLRFEERVAAVMACGSFFNSGLMIAHPSLPELKRLLALLRHAAHLKRACEVKPGDQTLLNHAFNHRWFRLPTSMVTKWKGHRNTTWNLRDTAVLHFLSEPKPWSRGASKQMLDVWVGQFGCGLQHDLRLVDVVPGSVPAAELDKDPYST
jgi:hypothetical protein